MVMTSSEAVSQPQPELCPEHHQLSKWHCGHCHKPLCPACKPIAYHYRVFHKTCLEAASHLEEKKSMPPPEDFPSAGVKLIAWFFLVLAVVTFGLGLLLLGVTLFSRRAVPMANWIGGAFPSLDDIPGGRPMLGWLSVLALGASGLQVFIGVGLLNCAQVARRLILVFSWTEILIAGLGWLVVLAGHKGFWDVPVLAFIFVIYFSRKAVRRQFEKISTLIEINR
jgi:hypothetical protein